MRVFHGVQLIVDNSVSFSVAGDASVVGLGCFNFSQNSYFSRRFPVNLQDSSIPIHLKEFLCVIISVKVWGQYWTGKTVEIFSDNDSVCDVITNMKPKDPKMQAYLREFLYWICKFNFKPVVSKIGTKQNNVTNFLLRNFSESDASTFFHKENLPSAKSVHIPDSAFEFIADW